MTRNSVVMQYLLWPVLLFQFFVTGYVYAIDDDSDGDRFGAYMMFGGMNSGVEADALLSLGVYYQNYNQTIYTAKYIKNVVPFGAIGIFDNGEDNQLIGKAFLVGKKWDSISLSGGAGYLKGDVYDPNYMDGRYKFSSGGFVYSAIWHPIKSGANVEISGGRLGLLGGGPGLVKYTSISLGVMY